MFFTCKNFMCSGFTWEQNLLQEMVCVCGGGEGWGKGYGGLAAPLPPFSYGSALLDISESDIMTTFQNRRYVNGIREIYIKLLSMNVGRNNVCSIIESVFEQFTNIRLAGLIPSPATTRNTCKDSSSSVNCGKRKFNISL